MKIHRQSPKPKQPLKKQPEVRPVFNIGYEEKSPSKF